MWEDEWAAAPEGTWVPDDIFLPRDEAFWLAPNPYIDTQTGCWSCGLAPVRSSQTDIGNYPILTFVSDRRNFGDEGGEEEETPRRRNGRRNPGKCPFVSRRKTLLQEHH
uniref:WGS project CBME000000000 data, contig CS3487_c000398 n=1 Tax=Fusarium pseudograminearum CS3487 TaxID=1318458 RepID=A0A096PD96_FUSPS|nr:unnamed protein product [Fusarium pseudograminearum CS3487]